MSKKPNINIYLFWLNIWSSKNFLIPNTLLSASKVCSCTICFRSRDGIDPKALAKMQLFTHWLMSDYYVAQYQGQILLNEENYFQEI